MATGVRFVPDKAGIQKIGEQPEMVTGLTEIGELVAARAREIGPKDDDADPHYVEDIDVDSGVENGVAIARVNANKFTSHWIEFGTEDTPAFAPLRRGAEAVGLHFVAGKGTD